MKKLKNEYEDIILIANSIGAFFSMNAGIDASISKPYFISPVVNMEQLILKIMYRANVTEEQLKAEGMISTAFGEDLSREYLCYMRGHWFHTDGQIRFLDKWIRECESVVSEKSCKIGWF